MVFAPPLYLSHIFWGLIITAIGLAIWKKNKDIEIDLFKDFSRFFLFWGLGFFIPFAIVGILGYILGSELLLTIGYPLSHFFGALAIGYLWKTTSRIYNPALLKYFWIFVIYGFLIVGFGLYEMPEIVIENSEVLLGPGSITSIIIGAGFSGGLMIMGILNLIFGFSNTGEDRKKFLILGTGIVLMGLAGIFHNIGGSILTPLGEITNLTWIIIYVLSVFRYKVFE